MRHDLYLDLYSTEEEHWWHRAKRSIVKEIIKHYSPCKNPIILDVGCGTGKNIESLKDLGRVVGVDISKDAIDFCKKRGIRTVVLGSVEKLPLSENKIDIVTALDVIEHVDEAKSLSEIVRVLKPDGIFICMVPAHMWLWSGWDVVLHHKKRYNKNEIVNAIEKSGMSVIKHSYVYSFLVIPVLIIRNIKRLFQKKGKVYTSDFNLTNNTINTLLYFLARLEHLLIKRYHVPFGTSVLCVAKKNPVPS